MPISLPFVEHTLGRRRRCCRGGDLWSLEINRLFRHLLTEQSSGWTTTILFARLHAFLSICQLKGGQDVGNERCRLTNRRNQDKKEKKEQEKINGYHLGILGIGFLEEKILRREDHYALSLLGPVGVSLSRPTSRRTSTRRKIDLE